MLLVILCRSFMCWKSSIIIVSFKVCCTGVEILNKKQMQAKTIQHFVTTVFASEASLGNKKKIRVVHNV